MLSYISEFSLFISPNVLVQFDYFEKVSTLKIIVFGECMIRQNTIQV